MHISTLTFWLLIGSVILAIMIVVASLMWSHFKRKSIVKKYQSKAPGSNIETKNKVVIRKNVGELLWEEKNKTKDPLDDYQMEYIINTIYRNQYKTFYIEGFDEQYEKKSIEKLAKSEYSQSKFDVVLINGEIEQLNDKFDSHYNKLEKGKMIIIANSSRYSKDIKKLLIYLKTIKAKYEWSKYGKGIIVVVK